MPKFSYRLRDQHGGLKTGVLEALDHRLAREDLVAAGWKIETLAPADPAAPAQPLPRPPAMVDFSEVFEKKSPPAPDPGSKSARPQLDQALEEALKPTRPSASGPPSGTFSRPPGREAGGPPSGVSSRPPQAGGPPSGVSSRPGAGPPSGVSSRPGAGPPSGALSRPQPGREASGPPSGVSSRPPPGREAAGSPSGVSSRPPPGREAAGPPSGSLSRPGRDAGSGPRTAPEPRRSYPTHTPTSSWRFLAIGALILVGLVVWVYQSRSNSPSSTSQTAQLKLHDVKVLVRGRLRLGDVSGAPRDARLTIHLPQIPLDVTRQGEQLKLSQEGDFQVEMNFQSSRLPARVEITASMPGYREEHLKEIPLKGDPLTAEVPPIVLKPR